MDTYFIVNPAAGRGGAMALLPQIRREMKKRGRPYKIYLTKGKGDGEAFVRRQAKAHPQGVLFFACGGDGTLHEVVNGAAGEKNAVVGLFPLGTGNDFVRNFTSQDNFLSPEAQLAGAPLRIDLLRVGNRYCVNMVNIGFDCDVVVKAAEWKKRPMVHGPMAYFLAAGSMFFRPMGKDMAFRRQGKGWRRGTYLLCTIANGSYCGGAFCSSPYARLDDGKMDAAFVGRVPRREFLRLLPAYRKGTYLEKMAGRKELEYFPCGQLEILTRQPQRASLDGEIYPFHGGEIAVKKGALAFWVPAGSHLSAKKEREDG